MTFADALAALIISSLFLAGFSQAVLPVYQAWGRAGQEYQTARSISFIAESFKAECAKPDRNMERWKKTVAVTKELQDCEITELRQGEVVRALKASCVIACEHIEIIGLCEP